MAACLILYGSTCYWKAKARTIDRERTNDGWENEAMFWRHHFDKKSAKWADEDL